MRFVLSIALLSAGLVAAAPVPQGGGCASFPPVKRLDLDEIYKDAKASIPDPAIEKSNEEKAAGVTSFLNAIEKALDGEPADKAAQSCLFNELKKWAKAGALTAQPKTYSRGGVARRDEVLIGFNIVALKFKAAGFALDGMTVHWLRTINDQNIESYQASRGNLYIWSGANAALSALFDYDPKAIQYQNQVWKDAMGAIKDTGVIESEMARGQRALIYHMSSFSATLVLRSAREALSMKEGPESKKKLRALADLIGKTLCDQEAMSTQAKAQQEMPGDWGFRVPSGFGADLLNDNWMNCGKPKADLHDQNTGGDTRKSAALLKQIAGNKKPQ